MKCHFNIIILSTDAYKLQVTLSYSVIEVSLVVLIVHVILHVYDS